MIKLRIDKAQRIKKEHSIFISFDFDMNIVNKLRSYPTRYYNPDTKEWEVPVSDLEYIKSDFRDYKILVTDNRQNVEKNTVKMRENTIVDIKDYKFKTKSFKHQTEGVKFGLEHTCWLLGDEQGLGKTKQAIDIACIKKQSNNYKHCLIICGVNGLKWNWRNEIHTHSNESCWILGQRNYKDDIVVKGNKEKIEDLKNIKHIKDYFIITNIESLRNKEITDLLSKLCKNNTINMVVADEIHKMKSSTSQQGKAFLKLQSEYKLAMTGTPIMNTPLDLYVILKWLGYEEHNLYAFKNHYCIMGGFGGYEIVGYKNTSEIRDLLDKIMLRRLKEDVLDLPDKLYIDEYVEMTPKQEQIYREIHNQIQANIDQIVLSPNPLAQLIRLRQATGYTGIVSSTVQESAKLDRMEELVEEVISNNKKVVIFSNWTNITNEIYVRLSKKYKGFEITGDTKDADRQHYVDTFQTDASIKFIVGSIGAMGTGHTLTAATTEIFVDEPWNRALFDQAVDRCHRIGAKENLTIYLLMCKNTIDERIHNIVQTKGSISDAIVDNKLVINKKEILNLLLQ